MENETLLYGLYVLVMASIGGIIYRCVRQFAKTESDLKRVGNLALVTAVLGVLVLFIALALNVYTWPEDGSVHQLLVYGLGWIGGIMMAVPIFGGFFYLLSSPVYGTPYEPDDSQPSAPVPPELPSTAGSGLSASTPTGEDISQNEQDAEQIPLARLVSGNDTSTIDQITVECPHCGSILSLSKKFYRAKGVCAKCSKRIMIEVNPVS